MTLSVAVAAGQGTRSAERAIKQLELPAARERAVWDLVALGPAAVEPLRRSLGDPRPEIVGSAIRALGFLGPAAAPALPALREIADGDDARLALAASSAASGIAGGRGDLLCVDFAAGELIELDGAGHRRSVIRDVRDVLDAERLANGHYLITDAQGVREIESSGETVWSFDAQGAVDVDRLSDGNTLIADTERGRVVEVAPDGTIVWTHAEDEPFRPVDADRLPDGNTLIADYQPDRPGRVFEVNAQGKVVWQVACKQPAEADRLPDGTTLITSHKPGLVRIVSSDGKVVRAIEDVGVPSRADGLPNGHVLVAGEGFVCEFDERGHKLWTEKMRWAVEVHRH